MSLTRSFRVPAPVTMASTYSLWRVIERAGHAAGQMFGEAQNGVERGAQFIRDMLDEIGFEPVGRFQRIAPVAQRAFDAEAVADIGEGDQGGAVGQGRQGQGQDGAVAALDIAHVALLRAAGDDLLDQPVPHRARRRICGWRSRRWRAHAARRRVRLRACPRCGRRRHCAASCARRGRTPRRLRPRCRAWPTAP